MVVLGLNPSRSPFGGTRSGRRRQTEAPARRSRECCLGLSPAGTVPVGHGQLQYTRSQPAVLSMVVWFDRSFDADGTIDYEINQLQNWTCPTERVTPACTARRESRSSGAACTLSASSLH